MAKIFRALFWIFYLNGFLSAQDSKSSVVNMIASHGYPAEEHKNIPTTDGYLLDMQRIPQGLTDGNETAVKTPVLVMHGIFGSAENWVVTGPEKGLAFILADAGYDVWLGNARGSTHSRKHVKLDPDLAEFWDFSWHEIGMYDLPAMIDYVLQETQQKRLFYVGHSQGTTAFFVMASERPSYNQKVRLMVALAPVAYLSNMGNPFLQVFSQVESGFNMVLSVLGADEVFPSNSLLNVAGETFCNEEALVQEVCTNLLFLIAGYDSDQINRTALPAILSNSPAGSSSKQVYHYAQSVATGDFRYYDYGYVMNLVKYGFTTPPRYRINRISCPVALIYAKNDWLVSPQDVKKLEKQLPNVVLSGLVPYGRFNHLDFLWANNVVEMVYRNVLELLKQF